MRRPNTFIVGAPKCGTTALTEYLRTHPNAFVSSPKEPNYWASDIREADDFGLHALDDYLKLFSGADAGQTTLIDASTSYLWSKVALDNILRFDGGAKLIVAVRNPSEIAYAYHMEECFWLHEDVADFETAWRLIEARRKGQHVPKLCPDPQKLDYARIASVGSQLQGMLERVDPRQVHIVLLDDLKRDPRQAYLAMLAFLDLPDDGRVDFPAVNSAKHVTHTWLSRLSLYPPPLLRPAFAIARSTLWAFGIYRIRNRLYRAMNEQRSRPPLSAALAAELNAFFASEIDLLERLLGRSLSHWRAAPLPADPSPAETPCS
jgi:hypothetical protein